MISKLKTFDLDTSSPRGWCKLGEPGDATEHGHQINNEDIERLKKHYNLQVSKHTINNNNYTLFALLNENATDTVVSVLGGDGKYYVIDSTILPDGLIMPFYEHCRKKNLNFIIIDPEYALEHAWNSFIIKPAFNIIPDKNTDFFNTLNSTTRKYFSNKIPIIKKLLVENKKHSILKEKYPWIEDVLKFSTDLEKILEYIKKLTHTNVWLMGHCSGCTMISLIYDFNKYEDLYKGIIFLNPIFKQTWKEELESMEYFYTPLNKPLLVIQHRDDKTIGANIHIAKKIVENASATIKAKYIELVDGTDQGSPTFSMGYHGFRDIENMVINAIDTFINVDLK